MSTKFAWEIVHGPNGGNYVRSPKAPIASSQSKTFWQARSLVFKLNAPAWSAWIRPGCHSGFKYTFRSENYAKTAGNLLLVRPRVLGSKASGILETKNPRKFPLEFDGPSRDTDTFEIALPPGYVVDELPPPANVDYSFGSYHSKTEASGNVLHYTRTVEIKELSVPVNKMDELRLFYRIIATDERNTAVLVPAGTR